MRVLPEIAGVLLDMDGVVRIGSDPVDGAAETLAALENGAIPYRFLTNTTTRSARELSEMLAAMEMTVPAERILTTHEVAVSYLLEKGRPSCHLLVRDEVRHLYDGLPSVETAPDCVVIGDIGDRWTYRIVDRVFNMVMAGAELVALHKGRYWQTERGLQIDIGAFVAGLEYATGKKATVLGKPSAAFFDTGIRQLGEIAREAVVMVGDDIESDIGGAQRAGLRGILVRTGKYRCEDMHRSSVRPDAVIDSIADLPHILGIRQ